MGIPAERSFDAVAGTEKVAVGDELHEEVVEKNADSDVHFPFLKIVTGPKGKNTGQWGRRRNWSGGVIAIRSMKFKKAAS